MVLLFGGAVGLAKADLARIEFFEKKVRPALVKHCYECHSSKSEKVKGGLLLDSKPGIRKFSSPSLKKSLFKRSTGKTKICRCPLRRNFPQTSRSLRTGQLGQDQHPRTGQTVVKDEIDVEKGKKFWSFRPLEVLLACLWARTPIDRFVKAGLETKGLRPAPDADKATLIRRVFFDLTGLPPSPDQLEGFLANNEPDAYEQVVDRLLASPQFGVRWGRRWLDVARYAESNGMERNAAFPYA